ncbi:unnamed protein product [Oppiella nova]|nr:unnamed protein product [Oppiella nova]CAG2178048.1 unnamed protein product [Oppiella nova]
MLRAGNNDFNWQFGVGAIWFSAHNGDINNATIEVKDCEIIDASYAAIMYIESKVSGVTFDNLLINGTGTFAIQLQTGGEATFKNVKAINVGETVPIYNCGVPFKMNIEGTKTGWYTDKPSCEDLSSIKPKWPWNW